MVSDLSEYIMPVMKSVICVDFSFVTNMESGRETISFIHNSTKLIFLPQLCQKIIHFFLFFFVGGGCGGQ